MPVETPIVNDDPSDGSVVYATAFDAVSLGLTGTDLEAVLLLAERQVDAALGPRAANPATGLKLDPAAMSGQRRALLARATVAQARYNLANAREVGGGPRVKSEAGPDFSVTYAEPSVATTADGFTLAPEAALLLASLGFARGAVRGARATP